ncbi:MAG: PQQ-dependent sugar dehydrogenase [Saprospiraceae bacterium]|nr:PQQ-dependent sugar dehydrogenase [Saprospiraceae bacterium]
MLKSFVFFAAFAPLLIFCINISPSKSADPEANYKTLCSGCHGEQMQAFVDRRWKYGNNKEDLFKSIKIGYTDGGMPGFAAALSDAEISALADYILTGIENVKRYDFANSKESPTSFKTKAMDIRVELVAENVGVPWSLAFLPDGDMLITDRGGKFYRRNTNGDLLTISGAPQVLAEGQGGLMEVILHPDYNKNKVIYLSYAAFKQEGGRTLSTTAIMRAVLEGNQLSDQKVIFEALPYARTRHHYGAKMAFDKNGYLFFSVGDRGNHNENPQSLNNHCGKIHRIKDDGSIPNDNPFVNTPNAMPTIWSYGHRNPQGLAIHPQTNAIWTNEHGPRGGDEVNLAEKGKNYGWPIISYGINYDGTTFTNKTAQDGMEQPKLYWVPSIAPSGMAFVQGKRYKAWDGDALVGSLRFNYLNRCEVKGNKIPGQEIMLENVGRLRDVRMALDGYIYIAVENPGRVYKLIPTN